MNGNIGGLISSWSYLSQFAPRQVRTHRSQRLTCQVHSRQRPQRRWIGDHYAARHCHLLLVRSLLEALLTLHRQKWENKQREMGRRDHLLEGLSADEIALLGHRHPNCE